MAQQNDARKLVEDLVNQVGAENAEDLLKALFSQQFSGFLDAPVDRQAPTLHPVPAAVRGFRVRLDLHGARPPVWRRLELPGDLTLLRLHDVIQMAMGWTDSHLHRFLTGNEHRAPYFLTHFDLEEGEEGVVEDGIRLDQVVTAEGDRLWYEYDFGDGWTHVLTVEKVLEEPPVAVRCTAGRLACPPEDCGGLGGYDELATWVRSGYDDDLLPQAFEDATHAREWLPLDWHPDHLDLEEINAALTVAIAEPVPVSGELAELSIQLDQRGIRLLREVLARPLSHGSTEIDSADADRLTEAYRVLLEEVGDGVALTAAGYLPPNLVEQLADRTRVSQWWIGKANREDLTPPVATLRETARALGLVSVRKGRLNPTAAGKRCRQDSQALWRHIVGRLPLGTTKGDRDAGWMALAVVGSGAPAEDWREEISNLLFALGWTSVGDRYARPSAHSPTLEVLEQLAGIARTDWRLTGIDLAVAASARAAIR